MGKKNKKNKSVAPASSGTAAAAPNFDESALNKLTESIEGRFNSVKSPKEKQPRESKDQISNSKKGKKRDSQGNVKDSKGSEPQNNRETLLQEILALGGTEEDLDLVADAPSDDEDVEGSGPSTSDKDLKKELAKFVSGLGIEVQADEESAGEEEPQIEDWEDEEDEISDEKIGEPIAAPPAKAATKVEQVKGGGKDGPRLVFEARPDWHVAELPQLPKPDMQELGVNRGTIEKLKEYAKSLLEADAELYASKHLSSTSSHRFLSTIMTSGTLSDKVSALTLVVQESPVHTTKSFESLLGLAQKRSRGQAVTALGAMKDLLAVGVVLPADRRLHTFAHQPGLLGTLQMEPAANAWKVGDKLPGDITKAHLISWAFEDWLKDIFFEMLKVLEVWCNDEIEYARGRAINYVYELLKEKPEQEANLLRLLVNKLGDPEKKLASRTSYLLLQLQTTHPLMKPIIIKSIENELLLRPGQSSHAKYYAINTLNQTILSAREEEVAQKLLSIYFGQFVTLLKKPEKKGEVAAPKVVTGPVLNKKGQVQGGGGKMGKKAMAKATKEEEAKQASEETNEKMISAVLTGVNRAFPFAGTDDTALEKHMDTLFRITHSSNFNTSLQALMLIQQLAASKAFALDRFYRTLYESLLDPRLVSSSKHAMYLNLLYKALKSDLNVKRVKAFAKRLLQVMTLHQPPFVCGVIYLIKELEITFPSLKSLISDPEEDDEDDEEVFRDVFDEDDGPSTAASKENMMHPDRLLPLPSNKNKYDGRKREPEHSNADKSCLWELLPFLVHFHPSVAMFADRLLSSTTMPPKPDLGSHSLIHFLDKFVYKNAKSAPAGPKGSSIMQPLAGSTSNASILVSSRSTKGLENVNSEAFWRKKAEDVDVDEVFFHKYFSQIKKADKASKKKDKKKDGESDEENDDDDIWQALVDSRPEIEGPDDDDESDLEMLDLDDSEASSVASDAEVDVDFGNSDDEDEAADSDGGANIWEDEDEEMVDVADGDEEDEDMDALFKKELEKNNPVVGESAEGLSGRKKKKKMKGLPTFASVDDYAELLGRDEDEDIG